MVSDKLYLALAVIVIIAVLYIVFIAKRRPYSGRPSQTSYDPDGNVLNARFNYTVDKYNSAVQMFQIELKKKQALCMERCDTDAMAQITKIMDGFDQNCEDIIAAVELCRQAASDGDIERMQQALERAEQMVGLMDVDVKNLRQVSVEDHVRRTEQREAASPHADRPRTSGFFTGCKTREETEKRYKALAKAYHPDMGYGDAEMFQQLQREYESVLGKMA